MSGNFDDDKPLTRVEFTQTELANMQKTSTMLQKNFMKQHVEITAMSTSDLTDMVRQEKQVYAILGIQYAVNALASMEKVKTQ